MDFKVGDEETEIKADIVVKKVETLKVWGQIRNRRDNGAAYVKVKLISIRLNGWKCIAETITDCEGYYDFKVTPDEEACEYKVMASRVDC